MSPSSIANCIYPWARSNEVNHIAALTACNASSICCKEKELHTVIAFRAQKSIHSPISPDFLWTITTWDVYGECEGQIMPCLSHVSKHLHTSACSWTGIVWCGRYTGLSVVVGMVCLRQSQRPKSSSHNENTDCHKWAPTIEPAEL